MQQFANITGTSARDGYLKITSRNSTVPVKDGGLLPLSDVPSIMGCYSDTASIALV